MTFASYYKCVWFNLVMICRCCELQKNVQMIIKNIPYLPFLIQEETSLYFYLFRKAKKKKEEINIQGTMKTILREYNGF